MLSSTNREQIVSKKPETAEAMEAEIRSAQTLSDAAAERYLKAAPQILRVSVFSTCILL